ncbi:hypothetical protein N0V90_007317 [Kalmusia sp. IMI 367209]|nr:hypothetical protein N0V90_007317 [Kalmusia sp. IMI 367209]
MSRAAAQLLRKDSHFCTSRIYVDRLSKTGSKPTASVGERANMWPQKRPDSPARDVAAGIIDSAMSSRRGSPQPSHKPNTGQDEQQVYILTLNLTPSISIPLDQMREEYFPKHLNRTPAHITLFHALPHSQIDTIDAELTRVTERTKPYHISTGKPFRLRKGVAVLLGSGDEQSQHLREELREKWYKWLSQQDNKSKGWQPHWTVMNKVEEEKKVQSAFNTLRRILFEDVHHGKVLGFDLWKYDHGSWEHTREYRFQGHERKTPKSSGGVDVEGYFEPRLKSREKDPKSPEETSKKAGGRWADMWKTVTLAKKSPRQDVERS